MKHGHYVINPGLSLRVEGEWRNIYQLLSFDMIAYEHQDDQQNSYWGDYDFNVIYQQNIERFAKRIKNYTEKETEDELV